MKPNDIFTVEDISVHIEADDRHRLEGRVLDWQSGIGVLEVATPSV